MDLAINNRNAEPFFQSWGHIVICIFYFKKSCITCPGALKETDHWLEWHKNDLVWLFSQLYLVPNQGTIGSGLVRLSVCPSVCLSVRLSRFNGGRLEPKRMGGFCSNLVCRYMTIWSSTFWGFHGARAKIVAKMSPKLHFNGGQLEPKCVDGLYSNLVCRCMNLWASAFWGFHGGRAKIDAKDARNIIAKIVAKIFTNVFSSDMM